jgi:putative membrane protein
MALSHLEDRSNLNRSVHGTRLALEGECLTMMWGGGWWVVGGLVMVVCIFMMGRMMMGHGGSWHGGHGDIEDQGNRSARDILGERFARGEISEEEFEQRKKVLGSSDQVHTAT